MRTPISRNLTLAAIAFTIAGHALRANAADEVAPAAAATPVPEASPAPEATPAPLTSGKVGGTAKVTATVEDIDVTKRLVTLKNENGEVTELAVPKTVRNLAQVKKGDLVEATYYEAIVYDVFKAGTDMPAEASAVASERAKPGEKPGGGVAEATTFTATIEAIDKPASKVTLKGPEGKTVTVKVKHPEKLDVVSVGDQVQITYTRALAISVKAAPKE